ncbi:MAG: adenylosuccinate synthase [Thermanaerothrix sp.]|nr:adenylosuccinate synthase [Thermanaerothrix sp.]
MKRRAEVIIGAQWGDEGKGRVVDALADRVDLVVRYQGGANAGHTVIAGGEKHVFHLLPSGMLYPGKTCVIGGGVVVDPDQLLAELAELRERGKDRARLVVSRNAHVVMPYHKTLDVLSERERSASQRIGTTSRGIGPCYVDKFARVGIRIGDLLDEDVLREKLALNLESKNLLLTRIYGEKPLAMDDLMDRAVQWGRQLAPYVGDAYVEVNRALDEGKGVLFEGAQGTLLDVDFGTYPYVTSSSPTSGGACTGVGVGPNRIDRVIGGAKAYCTRVGEGPFPTELNCEIGSRLREVGNEYGATTGRPRRCGWLDLVALKYSVMVNGLDAIALTKLDVLSGLEQIKVAVEYRIDGESTGYFPTDHRMLSVAEPVYKTLKGFTEDISGCQSFDDLPKAAKDYVAFVEEFCGVPVVLLGVGPAREATIIRGL